MASTPENWDAADPSGGDSPSFEEIARALQGIMSGQGDADPEVLRSLGLPTDPAVLRGMMQQAQSMFTSAADPESSWAQARETARSLAAGTGGAEAAASDAERSGVDQAFRLASLWLDETTAFESLPVQPRVYTRTQWVEASFGTFREMTAPIAASVSAAMKSAFETQAPPEMAAMISGASAMLDGVGQSLFALQLGQAVGTLAGSVLSTGDVGVPLVKGSLGLVPRNVAAFAEGFDLSADEINIYLALREEAHARLFHRAPWLRAHVLRAVADFAAGIEIDPSRMEEVARQIDPSAPGSFEEALGEGLFQPATTPAQAEALTRLETLLALIEGWVDVVVNASAARLPSAAMLAETIRRRRVTQGPTEQAFAGLVGLELRPRRLRDAAALFHFIEAEGGSEARDAVWAHPDLLPSPADLDDPAGYTSRQRERAAADADVDAELEKLLSGGYDTAPDGQDGPGGRGGDDAPGGSAGPRGDEESPGSGEKPAEDGPRP
ncbi:zinc-dependent metalloprotease [Falsarthrobacter nasiphocae]|uniref:Hydrolase n=1 Tax=Falsarthrobacter nasiphocae TaxID=189863 RepID=A0AAE4C7H2_9MICC|nr:zinc-dependent metalloprotease [Falsarthrobacter nasiphocae]MDR6891445.1 putative hydrolase [Falsarthrobacter nasiphocae]